MLCKILICMHIKKNLASNDRIELSIMGGCVAHKIYAIWESNMNYFYNILISVLIIYGIILAFFKKKKLYKSKSE